MWRKILVATDGSGPSARAEELAFTLAKRFGALLVVVSVAKIPSEEERGYQVEEAMELVNRFLANAKAAGLAAEGRVERGDPSARIVQAAEDTGADAIVLGTAGRTGLSLAALGSVAERVVRNSTRTVVIAK